MFLPVATAALQAGLCCVGHGAPELLVEWATMHFVWEIIGLYIC